MFRKILIWSIALLALGYVACAIFLDVEQRTLLYFPQYTHVEPGQTNFALQRGAVTLRGWVMHPGQSRALIYFGGNGDAVQTMREDYARWASDRTVYLLAYRGYGASDGAPTEAALFGDALALYDDVRTRQQDIAVVGRSLGSGVATWLAAQRPLQKLVLVIAAEDDRVVPAASTARLMETFSPRPQYIRLDHTGHGNIVNDPAYAAAVTNFLR